ncbi:TetR/AcrR family transcriptional regulator [Nocardia sp. NPDC059177]|uniref:TetR/AcrR family transcriptional regulator n=1 Tax=Nocardia sp. NPDC059177 TaxID=3346759 RepID=UPI00369AE316
MPRPVDIDSAEPPVARRADTRRNARRLLAAATAVLAQNPAATMTDIADAAELTRATVYRYYRHREDLITAIRALAEAEIAALVAELPARGPALPALVALLESSVELGMRYRYLVLNPGGLDPTETVVQARDTVAEFIARGQRAGELDVSLDPKLVAQMFLGMVMSAVTPITLGEITREQAVPQVSRALVKLLS